MSVATASATYTKINELAISTQVDTASLRASLEKGSDEDRIRAMKEIVTLTLANEPLPNLLMDIIRFVLPNKNKQLKKLLHAYWEVVPKHDEHGKLKQEMILVVNAIRNDLQHPNEFIRGSTLRLLSKFNDTELLDPLIPTIRQCLEHRHAYVRKNAVFCILGIALLEETTHLIPDAAELIYAFLLNETDATCRRNAFVALTKLDRATAYAFFHSAYTNIVAADEMLQIAFIDFAAKDAVDSPELAEMYVQILLSWLNQAKGSAATSVVAYESATALSQLSVDPAVLIDVSAAYIDIAVRESDTSVKITALNRVSALAEDDSLSQLVMDVLLVLPTQDIGVRKTALKLALKLVTNRTVDQVLRLLKKELANSIGQKYDSADEYRHAIVDTIDEIALRFKESAGDVVTLLLEFIGELSTNSALEVMDFVKQVIELHIEKRESVVNQLADALYSIHSARAYLSALWVLGEYTLTEAELDKVWTSIKEAIGTIPFDAPESSGTKNKGAKNASTKPRVLADGTYATESPLELAAAAAAEAADDSQSLRRLLLDGNFFLAGAFSATLTKLVIRYSIAAKDAAVVNKKKAEAMLIMSSLIRTQSSKINDDAFDRIYGCINLLVQGTSSEQEEFLLKPHAAFQDFQSKSLEVKAKKLEAATAQTAVQVEQPVNFRLFRKLEGATTKNTKSWNRKSMPIVSTTNQSQLKQVKQLSGYSDPVYAEALISVSQFDIVVEVMVFNQTTETLQNLKVQLYGTADIKVLNSSAPSNVAPMSFHTCRIIIRVSSVSSALIYGDISYDHKDSLGIILLNDFHLNVLDYINSCSCSDEDFKTQWVKFDWENKLAVDKKISIQDFLQEFKKLTNLYCITEDAAEDNTGFLSANFHAKSSFGEVVLANLSLMTQDGFVKGHVRVRAQQKGAAVSIGEGLESLLS